MYPVLTILIVILAVILILVVLVQNSKGGGLNPQFSSTNQIMGVRKTTDFLEKTTWTLIALIVILSVAATGFHSVKQSTSTSEISDRVEMPTQQAPQAANFDDAVPMDAAGEEEATNTTEE